MGTALEGGEGESSTQREGWEGGGEKRLGEGWV